MLSNDLFASGLEPQFVFFDPQALAYPFLKISIILSNCVINFRNFLPNNVHLSAGNIFQKTTSR